MLSQYWINKAIYYVTLRKFKGFVDLCPFYSVGYLESQGQAKDCAPCRILFPKYNNSRGCPCHYLHMGRKGVKARFWKVMEESDAKWKSL